MRIRLSTVPLVVMAALAAPASVAPAQAQVADRGAEASRLVQDFNREAAEILLDVKASDADRSSRFLALLRKSYGLDFLAGFLGGAALKAASPAEQAEYARLFPDYVTRLYVGQFTPLANKTQRLVTVSQRSATEYFVRTEFDRRMGSVVTLDWRLRPGADGKLKIIDVASNGVSNALGKRAQFGALARDQGFATVLAALKK